MNTQSYKSNEIDAQSPFFRALNAPFKSTPFPASLAVAEPKLPNPVVTADHQPLGKPLFTATGDWEWLNERVFYDIHNLQTLHSEELYSTTLRTCRAGDRSFACLNKSWNLETRHPGIMSELWLYKNPLRALQGRSIPKLIAVRVSPSRFNLVFELPHQTFFIEPSADMPDVLKRRVVDAIEKLHSKGVAHHALNLEDILIGGDGQVYICNFHHARFLEEQRVVHLPKVKEGEFAMEMRRIKFKLDFQGARLKEQEWLRQRVERTRAELEEVKQRDARSPKKKVTLGLGQVEAIKIKEAEGWFTEIDREPRRFITPGQGEDDFEWELKRFHNILRHMEEEDLTAHLPAADISTSLPFISPTRSHFMSQSMASPSFAGTKRKHSEVEENITQNVATTNANGTRSSRHAKGSSDYVNNEDLSTVAGPSNANSTSSGFKNDELRSSFRLVSPYDIHTSVQENNLIDAWPMIVVRDFVNDPMSTAGEGNLGTRLRRKRQERLERWRTVKMEQPIKRQKLDENGSWTSWASSALSPLYTFVSGVYSRLAIPFPANVPSNQRTVRVQAHRHKRTPTLLVGSPPRKLEDLLKHPALVAISYSESASSTPAPSVHMTKRMGSTLSLAPAHSFPIPVGLGVATPLESINRVLDGLIRPLT